MFGTYEEPFRYETTKKDCWYILNAFLVPVRVVITYMEGHFDRLSDREKRRVRVAELVEATSHFVTF